MTKLLCRYKRNYHTHTKEKLPKQRIKEIIPKKNFINRE